MKRPLTTRPDKSLKIVVALLALRWHPDCIPNSFMLDNVGAGIEQYMNLVSARQKLVASNIANADTPGYQTKDIDFESELQSQIRVPSPT